MATADQILYVRYNAAVTDEVTYTDEMIGDLIDAVGINGAIASLWEQKAASAASYVDVTEAGASHKFSDVYKNYIAQAKYWRDMDGGTDEETGVGGRVRVKKIVRS